MITMKYPEPWRSIRKKRNNLSNLHLSPFFSSRGGGFDRIAASFQFQMIRHEYLDSLHSDRIFREKFSGIFSFEWAIMPEDPHIHAGLTV